MPVCRTNQPNDSDTSTAGDSQSETQIDQMRVHCCVIRLRSGKNVIQRKQRFSDVNANRRYEQRRVPWNLHVNQLERGALNANVRMRDATYESFAGRSRTKANRWRAQRRNAGFESRGVWKFRQLRPTQSRPKPLTGTSRKDGKNSID